MPLRPGWSLAMIVRDEERIIGRVLNDAASLCDEIIVVDTGSTDRTKAVCAAAGARVVDFEWCDDFSAARTRSFEECSCEWILWLDADDRVPTGALEGLGLLKEHLPTEHDVGAVLVPYRREFLESDPRICVGTLERERLVRNQPGTVWREPVHEYVEVPAGRFIRWPSAWVEHRPLPEAQANKAGRNLRILERQYGEGDRRARTLFYLANEYKDHHRWEEALATYESFLDASDAQGWERHAALRFMALCAARLGWDDDQVRYLFRAVELDPSRAEPWLYLGMVHYGRRDWAGAVPFLAAAASLTRPEDGLIEEAAYSWGPWEFLSVCHSEMGQYEQALDEAVEALRAGSPNRTRLQANIEVFLDRT